MAQNGQVLRHASAKLKANKETVLKAVAQDGNSLECASAELKADKEVVLSAMNIENALKFACEELRCGGIKAYASFLLGVFSVPVSTFVVTVLHGSMAPQPTPRFLSFGSVAPDEVSPTTVARRRIHSSCILQKLNAHGTHHAVGLKKRIAAFAGVPCRDISHVPWSSVQSAMRVLHREELQAKSAEGAAHI